MYLLLAAALVADPTPTPEEKALAYLAREVPRWSVENKCYSCHNNGDAARALYQAKQHSYPVPAKALDNTTRWLERPADWAHNGGEGPFNDKVLSRVQFATSLLDALESGYTKDRVPLKKAADLVAKQQTMEGFWQIGAADSLGSPATHGNCLATVFARRVLAQADPERHRKAIAAADRWLRTVPVKTVLDAAAVLLGLANARDGEAKTQCKRCLVLIRKGEAKDGGWGPYVTSSPEPFDTAVVLLALARLPDQREPIRRGRAFLISTQRPDGAWRETTRPAGDQSYAQRVSTTGWALQALLATRNDPATR